MVVLDIGRGRALVMVPGLPGRHEWLNPAIPALATRFRVLSFSLTDVPTDRFFDRAVDRLDRLVRDAGVEEAVIGGISFGGLVAAVFAGRRPERTSHLVLSSAPSPRYQLDARSASYVRHPTTSLPLFALRGARRIGPEILASLPTWRERALFVGRFGLTALSSPGSPRRMAEWITEWMRADLAADVRAIVAPTLVVTGDPALDQVVPAESSLDYLALVPGARHKVMARTGHLGALARPHEFAAIIDTFVGPREGQADRIPSCQ